MGSENTITSNGKQEKCWNCDAELDNDTWCNNCRAPLREDIKTEILNREEIMDVLKCWRCKGTTQGDICSVCGSPLTKKGISLLLEAISDIPTEIVEEDEDKYMAVFSPKDNHFVIVNIPSMHILDLARKHFEVYNATITKTGPEIIVYKPKDKSAYHNFEHERIFVEKNIRVLYSKTKSTSIDNIAAKIQFFYWKPEDTKHRFSFSKIQWKALLLLISLVTIFLSGWFYYQRIYSLLELPNKTAIYAIIFSLVLISILLAHETSHYLMQRRRGIALSLPFFLPLPPIPGFLSFFLIGTAGGFVRVINPIRKREDLFDIYFIGPFVGVILSICFYLIGLAFPIIRELSALTPDIIAEISDYSKYDPVSLASLALNWFGKATNIAPSFNAETQVMFLHPLTYAGFTGLIINGLNFLPGALLDGGFLFRSMVNSKVSKALSFFTSALIMLNYNTWALGILVMYMPISKYDTPVTNEAQHIHWSRYILLSLGFILAIGCYPLPPLFSDLIY